MAPWSLVKHSTTEPLRSHHLQVKRNMKYKNAIYFAIFALEYFALENVKIFCIGILPRDPHS